MEARAAKMVGDSVFGSGVLGAGAARVVSWVGVRETLPGAAGGASAGVAATGCSAGATKRNSSPG